METVPTYMQLEIFHHAIKQLITQTRLMNSMYKADLDLRNSNLNQKSQEAIY